MSTCICICVCMHADPKELELQMAVSYYVCARNQTRRQQLWTHSGSELQSSENKKNAIVCQTGVPHRVHYNPSMATTHSKYMFKSLQNLRCVTNWILWSVSMIYPSTHSCFDKVENDRGWRDESIVLKNACCSSRGLWWILSTHTLLTTGTPFPEDLMFQLPWALGMHVVHRQTHRQDTQIQKSTKQELVRW